MSESRNNIVAVILNWNGYDLLREGLESLKQSSQRIEKTLIIDNASSDGSAEKLVRSFRNDPNIEVIRNATNEGFARGVNKGIRLAISKGATHVFLMNNDAILGRECLGKLVNYLDAEAFAIAASPTIFYRKQNKKIWQGAGYFSYLRANVVVPDKNRLMEVVPEGCREVTFLSGCALLLKARYIGRVGFFDEEFFMYVEDVEFCLRARKRGYKLLYVPSAFAWHNIEDAATARSSQFVMYHRARSMMTLYRKSFSFAYMLYALIVHFIVYTPYRLWQSYRSRSILKSFGGWLHGSVNGLLSPSRN